MVANIDFFNFLSNIVYIETFYPGHSNNWPEICHLSSSFPFYFCRIGILSFFTIRSSIAIYVWTLAKAMAFLVIFISFIARPSALFSAGISSIHKIGTSPGSVCNYLWVHEQVAQFVKGISPVGRGSSEIIGILCICLGIFSDDHRKWDTRQVKPANHSLSPWLWNILFHNIYSGFLIYFFPNLLINCPSFLHFLFWL